MIGLHKIHKVSKIKFSNLTLISQKLPEGKREKPDLSYKYKKLKEDFILYFAVCGRTASFIPSNFL